MLGENFHGPRDMHEALKARACDMVMPDLMRIGGITGWMRAAAIAEQYGIDVSSHLMPEISAHLMLATPTAVGWSGQTGLSRFSKTTLWWKMAI